MSAYGHSRARMIARNGVSITLRRLVNKADPIDCSTLAVMAAYSAGQVQAGMQQGDSRADLANDIASTGWPLPPRPKDQVIVDGATYTVQGATPVRTPDGIIGWTLWLRGTQ